MPARARSYCTAADRWAGVGPYYAMFPTWFSDHVVDQHTSEGDVVLDPFAGRGTAIFSAARLGRRGVGIEINPVGWVYGQAKLAPSDADAVAARFEEVGLLAGRFRQAAKELPPFFRSCYSLDVRAFLLAARGSLNWRANKADRTAMALLLVYLHGKQGSALSNQMRQTKAMAPDYAIRWWRDRGLSAPQLDPVSFLLKRLLWRYAKGQPEFLDSRVVLGNSLAVLPRLSERVGRGGASLLLTSPPYRFLANYHYDQWIRLWALGGPPNAIRSGEGYRSLLAGVFAKAAPLMARRATVYVRTSRRSDTLEATVDALRGAFPVARVRRRARPFPPTTQTHLFGDRATKVGEVDLVVRLG